MLGSIKEKNVVRIAINGFRTEFLNNLTFLVTFTLS